MKTCQKLPSVGLATRVTGKAIPWPRSSWVGASVSFLALAVPEAIQLLLDAFTPLPQNLRPNPSCAPKKTTIRSIDGERN